jgi:hypothetical protein
MAKIEVAWTGSETYDEYYYENYEDENGNVYYLKYKVIGWFKDDDTPLGADVEVEVI